MFVVILAPSLVGVRMLVSHVRQNAEEVVVSSVYWHMQRDRGVGGEMLELDECLLSAPSFGAYGPLAAKRRILQRRLQLSVLSCNIDLLFVTCIRGRLPAARVARDRLEVAIRWPAFPVPPAESKRSIVMPVWDFAVE